MRCSTHWTYQTARGLVMQVGAAREHWVEGCYPRIEDRLQARCTWDAAQHVSTAWGSACHPLRLNTRPCPAPALFPIPTGAAALAACLSSSHGHSLIVLSMCGCEVTNEGAAALAAAVSGDSMAHANDAAHSGRSGSTDRRPVQHRPCLQELRLADNQITAAGGWVCDRSADSS